MRALFCLAAWWMLGASIFAADAPPKPARYFNDYAGMVSAQAATGLNRALEDFEKQTSSQILVAIYPKLPENSALEDFTIRAAEAWKPGQEDKDNGAILFIFRDDRKMRIEVGYGLEGAVPDSVAARIINNEITPRFRAQDFEGGITAGVTALMQAARGEYQGTGNTVASRGRAKKNRGVSLIVLVFIVFMLALSGFHRSGTVYHRRRRNYWGGWGAGLGGWGGGWKGGGGSWGGGGGGWGGGFSGGGGGFGGGGASGGW